MAGLTCDHLTPLLEAHAEQGAPLSSAAREHLRHCPDCQADLRLLLDLQRTLLSQPPEVAPPPAAREALLQAARQTPGRATRPPRRWTPAALGSAAALTGLIATLSLLAPSRGAAHVLPDPAVVVTTGRNLLVASNDRGGTLTVLRGDHVQASLTVRGAQTPWYTEGVRLGDRVFLADAANNRVLEVRVQPLQLLRSYPVPGGVAGLTATQDDRGARVYFKGARGTVGVVGGAQVALAREAALPLADVMDGVTLLGGTLWVTHHLTGELCALDPHTLTVRRRVPVGGHPVALATYRGDLLVLDVAGRLLHLTPSGTLIRQWRVPGHPDKFTLNDTTAVLSDRAGLLTRVPLDAGPVTQMPVRHPMDVTPLPGGQFAVAEGGSGVRVLDRDLHTHLTLDTTARSE